MKTILFCSFLLSAFSSASPFSGGDGSGNTSARFAGFIDGSPSLFFGGNGDGNDNQSVSSMLGTSALLDSDGDGMPDSYEVLNSLNPSANDAGLDPDGDGMNNLSEYLFCTNPQDSSDRTDLSLILGAGTSTANLLWPGIVGKTYAVYLSHDLENWFFEKDVSAGATGPQATSILLEGKARLFFRLEVNE